MVGNRVGFFFTVICVFHACLCESGFATTSRSVSCHQQLLNGTPSVVVEVSERRLGYGDRREMLWEDRLLLDHGLLKPRETIRIPSAMLHFGRHDARGFTQALEQIGETRTGRYLLQFLIRLSYAVGRSHGIDAEDADHIAASVFVSLANSQHDLVDGEPVNGVTKNNFGLSPKLSQFQEMLYSILPSVQHLEHYRDRKPAPGRPKGPSAQSMWLLRFADGMASLMQYNQGVEVRDTWEENSIALLQYLKLFSGTTATNENGYCHELNSYQQGKRSFLISEWDALTRWDNQVVPVLPIANQSSAFEYLKTYLAQATYRDDHMLGGLIALNRREANKLTTEALKFMEAFDPYLQVVRGARIVSEGIANQQLPPPRPQRDETAARKYENN